MNYKIIILLISSLFTVKVFAIGNISIHGYGTVGLAYQDDDKTLYRNSINTKEGSSANFSLANYSSFGLQLDVQASKKISLVAQGVASKKNNNGKTLELSWLNAKYQLNDDFFLRVGKMRLAAFMYSDILDVSYSYDWMRLPDMYSIVPINNYIGVEFNHNIELGNFTFMSTYLYGQSKSVFYDNLPDGKILKGDIDTDKIYGASLKVLYDNLALRFAYCDLKLTLHSKSLDTNLNQLNSLNIPLVTQAIDEYSMENTSMSYLEIGARYDFEKAYLLGEYIELNSHSFTSNNSSWYLGTGYNFESWSPFMLYSQTKSVNQYKDIKTDKNMNPALLGAINASNEALKSISESIGNVNLETFSLGLRYNLSENSIIKLQYDKQVEEKGSKVNFHFSENKKVNLDIFSGAVSFVF